MGIEDFVLGSIYGRLEKLLESQVFKEILHFVSLESAHQDDPFCDWIVNNLLPWPRHALRK
jgi:hypothetical protein